MVGVVSAYPAEGKTTFCFGLALASSRARKRVLLVDADPRLATLSGLDDLWKRFDKKSIPNDTSSPWERFNLPIDDESIELLVFRDGRKAYNQRIWDTFADEIDSYREEFDIIILDFPPRIVPDIAFASHAIDTLVYTLRWNRYSSDVHRKTFSVLKDDGLPIELVVLNAINSRQYRIFSSQGFGFPGYYYN